MNARQRIEGGRAVIAARKPDVQPDTTEIEQLAATAGFEVVSTVTQRRQEDTTYNIGRGKAEELAEEVALHRAGTVVFDGRLTPGQYGDLLDLLPGETGLVDRYRLVLEIFKQRAGDRRAALQAELASLRYELPRLRQTSEEPLLNRATEKGSPVLDTEKRIDTLREQLDSIAERAAQRRTERRSEGFDLVAITGYTNAGKSTLLHRLADDLSVESEGRHDDLADPISVRDRLFETLETTTRRGTLDDRRVLFTDTVGLIDDLPHDLIRSFSTTLDEISDSDVVLAVIDASLDLDRMRRRARVTMRVLGQGSFDRQGPPDSRPGAGAPGERPRHVLPVLNKADRLNQDAVAEKRAMVREIAPDAHAPVAISALDGQGIDTLRRRLQDVLPERKATFVLPNDGETQSFLAWAHDRATVTTEYHGDSVAIRIRGNPTVVSEATQRAPDSEA